MDRDFYEGELPNYSGGEDYYSSIFEWAYMIFGLEFYIKSLD